ncbi:protein YhfH [Peribacillus sp. B-H-3]
MQTKNPMEFFRNLPPKTCPECGEHMTEQAESYRVECDSCLANHDK